MSKGERSLLELSLLGLVRQRQPCSGYDLRKIFSLTPMGTFSDSPGAIYPALRRLENSGLIDGRIEVTASVRRRKLYHVSPKAETLLRKWLAKPVERRDVIRGMEELTLRFAFMEEIAGRKACVSFLESLSKELESYIVVLRGHLKSLGPKMSLSAKLALQDGIMGYESKMAWASMAARSYRSAQS